MPNALQRSEAQRLRSINHKMPPFPCVVLFLGRNERNRSFRVQTFSDQETFDHVWRMSVALVRVLLTPEDLADLPPDALYHVVKSVKESEGEAPVTEQELAAMPTAELLQLAFDTLKSVAIPYEETPMGESTTAAVEAKNKTEAKAQEKKAKEAAKAEKKAADKAAREAKRSDGVIGTIKAALDTEAGTTASEVLDTLVAKFPDRTRDGMSSTVKIQFSRLAKSQNREIINENIVARGRVYKFADKGPVPGVIVPVDPKPTNKENADAKAEAVATLSDTDAPAATEAKPAAVKTAAKTAAKPAAK